MWKATWCDGWGQRGQRVYHSKFFTRKPSIKEVVKAFAELCPSMNKKWFRPECSGLVTISEIKVEF